ncbi:hypothetical protein [Lactococcus hircilactis]
MKKFLSVLTKRATNSRFFLSVTSFFDSTERTTQKHKTAKF